MNFSDIIKSVIGTIFTFFAWVSGKNVEARFPETEDFNFCVGIVAGLLTALYTTLKIIDWFSQRKIKKAKAHE